MNKRIINKDYIAVIKEENNLLKYEEIGIPYPRNLVEQIENIGKNEQCTILDVQAAFLMHFRKEITRKPGIDYLYPNEYNSSFNKQTDIPIFYDAENFPTYDLYIGLNSFQIHDKYYRLCPSGFNSNENYYTFLKTKSEELYNQNLKKVLNDFLRKYGIHPEQNSKEIEELTKLKESDFKYDIEIVALKKIFFDAVNHQTETDISNLTHDLRTSFAKGVIRYIHANSYTTLKNKISLSTLMLSTETIGWTYYSYSITSNERIEVKSNFGYGSKSYCYCNLFYKDIPILPYTDTVKYNSVNWQEVINYTRCYKPVREICWKRMFDFVVNVSNLIKQDSQKFIDVFIVGEIQEMMNKLRNLLSMSPKDIIFNIKHFKQDENNSNTIYVWNSELQNEYNIYPQELGDSLKVEKISGCLYFLDNLQKLNEYIPVIQQFIDELIDFNKQIQPLLLSYIVKLPCEIQKITVEIDLLTKKSSEIFLCMTQCREANTPELDELLKLEIRLRDEYICSHPNINSAYQEYQRLDEQYRELNARLTEKNRHLQLRKNFLKKYEECRDRIDELLN